MHAGNCRDTEVLTQVKVSQKFPRWTVPDRKVADWPRTHTEHISDATTVTDE
jgi:hypothetical protein